MGDSFLLVSECLVFKYGHFLEQSVITGDKLIWWECCKNCRKCVKSQLTGGCFKKVGPYSDMFLETWELVFGVKMMLQTGWHHWENWQTVQGQPLTPSLSSSSSSLPPWVEFLRSLAGLVRLSPTPCRCYRLEHSRNTKWGDWSLLDLWLLVSHQPNGLPHLVLPLSPIYYPLTPTSYPFLSLLALAAS